MITMLLLFLTWLFAGAIENDLLHLAIWITVLFLGVFVFRHEYLRRRQ